VYVFMCTNWTETGQCKAVAGPEIDLRGGERTFSNVVGGGVEGRLKSNQCSSLKPALKSMELITTKLWFIIYLCKKYNY